MITFKTITFKNFQAVGNRPITIQLDRSPTTMIAGHNGSGKSNVLEAITYSLFGKPLKKVNLGGLINSINKKNLLVTIDFNIKGKDYKIVRGQKPNVLEFYVNGELVDQSAASKDYQAKIEYALGMDYKMFTQMVVLNKEKYIPFLELSAADRRKIVEDILDISVFSHMSDQLKIEQRTLSTSVQDAQYEITRTQDKIRAQHRLIQEASNNNDAQVKEILEEVKELENSIDELQQQRTACVVESTAALETELNNLQQLTYKAIELGSRLSGTVNDKQKMLNFFNANDVCPTCKQSIDSNFKHQHTTALSTEIQQAQVKISGVEQGNVAIKDKTAAIRTQINDIKTANSVADQLDRQITMTQNSITALQRKAVALSAKKVNVDYQSELDVLLQKETDQQAALNVLLAEQDTLAKCKDLLKDEAIKAAVVAEYIDFINSRVNEYLNAMEFYINIRLDENFNDKIESVNRDGFTYDNLSTGQKCRVSLAICLALMEVAALKNSVTSNILCVDEILEPLDVNGVSLFMKLVREKLSHKNVFVITQRSEEFADYFRNQINFRLNEGFTEIF